jgi:hypothetical protein
VITITFSFFLLMILVLHPHPSDGHHKIPIFAGALGGKRHFRDDRHGGIVIP